MNNVMELMKKVLEARIARYQKVASDSILNDHERYTEYSAMVTELKSVIRNIDELCESEDAQAWADILILSEHFWRLGGGAMMSRESETNVFYIFRGEKYPFLPYDVVRKALTI